jgi:GTP pyrophosphokinase
VQRQSPTIESRPPELLGAAAAGLPMQPLARERARAFAEPLIGQHRLDTGENVLAHADAVTAILSEMGAAESIQAANYLVYACDHLQKPRELIGRAFGEHYALLATETHKLVQVLRQTRAASGEAPSAATPAQQQENVRKMLLAFSRDPRVVLLRLASRLQTLRYHAAMRTPPAPGVAQETLSVTAPLANRLGIWQIKWELEDLALRFLEPEIYREIAAALDEKRVEREQFVEQLRGRLEAELRGQGVAASVAGRPKHIYSIVKKMRGKSLPFERVYDVRAMRVIVSSVADCYAALSWVHAHYAPEVGEFDDYIAKPKPNGYQSLHTVVRDEAGRAVEIQIRTRQMHEHAEHGVAAHWAYKEAGTKGYAGVLADSGYDAKIAVLRQLLAWERDVHVDASGQALFDDRVYVLTPQASVIDLPQGATPVDFAYAVHTSLGHRCRGARVDGVLVPLSTKLANGQTVDIITAKEGMGAGPSRDWLQAEGGYLASPRARAKVRAWFNAQAEHEAIEAGREIVEKLLQREGKTVVRHAELAARVGFASPEAMFEALAKDELSLRTLEVCLHPERAPKPLSPQEVIEQAAFARKSQPRRAGGRGQVLVEGVDALATQLAKCCRPAPPDAIVGFVTRGQGVSVHRVECRHLHALARTRGERIVEVAWANGATGKEVESAVAGGMVYAVDVVVDADERPQVLKDCSELLARERITVSAVQSNRSLRHGTPSLRWVFTVQVGDTVRLGRVLAQMATVEGVRTARRR